MKNRREEVLESFNKQARWYPGKGTLKALRAYSDDVIKGLKEVGEAKADSVTEAVIKEIRSEGSKLRKAGLIGFGIGGASAGVAGALAAPYAARFHKELQEVEKVIGLPVSGDLPGKESESFVRGFSDKTKDLFGKK